MGKLDWMLDRLKGVRIGTPVKYDSDLPELQSTKDDPDISLSLDQCQIVQSVQSIPNYSNNTSSTSKEFDSKRFSLPLDWGLYQLCDAQTDSNPESENNTKSTLKNFDYLNSICLTRPTHEQNHPKTKISPIASKRIFNDYIEFCREELTGIWVSEPDDTFQWSVTMSGPEKSPYEGEIYEAKLVFSTNHPFSPPKITFITPMFHPNIFPTGEVCVDGLQQENWNPYNTIWSILLSVKFLLGDPNPNIPANEIAATFFLQSPAEYKRMVRDVINSGKTGIDGNDI